MKLLEALRIADQAAKAPGEAYEVSLLCSFTPLHLKVFLTAELSLLAPGRAIRVREGTYGDLTVNLERAVSDGAPAAVVAMEWFDLDPRLGIRALGGWGASRGVDIAAVARESAGRFRSLLTTTASRGTIILSPPSLPFPPVFPTPDSQLGREEAQVRQVTDELTSWATAQPHIRVLHPERIQGVSPLGNRWDVRQDLVSGFPYTLGHAGAVAEQCARLLLPTPPLKGIITDLDDTLWRGITGEVGPDGVAWTLEHGAQVHGLYQQALAALAEMGVLIAAASKNESGIVEKALVRPDLAIPREQLFPVEANWGPKSESVERVLRTWNIGEDSVVFIDDSPMEVGEVKAAFPTMECFLFPKENPSAVIELIRTLRNRFGKAAASHEDTLRRRSLQDGQRFEREAVTSSDREAFLSRLEGFLTIDRASGRQDARALELINKTNQFNLNGDRAAEADWHARGLREGDFVVAVSYADRFGPLGKIAVISGLRTQDGVTVENWVMSCRAFSRRIEHHCLKYLFDSFEIPGIDLCYRPTERNGPLRDCLQELLGAAPGPVVHLSREQFERQCPPLYHELRESPHG